MKRILFILCCLAFTNAYAQTYNNGTWYALYDETEHTMNTQGDYETGVFAPTKGTLNVQWRYVWVDLFGAFKKIATGVLESADNGGSTNQVGSLAENTGKNSNTTEKFTVSRNINWIKFNREGAPTHKVILYHLDIALAQHILLADGTYGTTTQSHDFGEVDALDTSKVYTIALRSFLSAGNITVHSSDPEIFHLGSADNTGDLTYAVGANACASANGTAKAASGGTLGKIDNYAVAVYFTPKEGKEYSATITISDGVSTAKVMVGGIGRKLKQTITWEPEAQVLSNATIPAASASSGLDVAYAFEPEGVIAVENGVLTIVGEGVATVTASQAGNKVYEAAEPVVRTITVFPALTRSEYSAAVCEGESYSDEHFDALTEAGLYYDTIPNVYGGDSVICLTLTVNPVYLLEDSATVYEGEAGTWQGIDLSGLPAGDTTLIVRYSAVTGCDSAHVLRLTVLHPTTYGNDTINLCAGESIEYEGKIYRRPAKDSVLLSIPNQYGGDSVVALVVNVLPAMRMKASLTITEGEDIEWQGMDLSMLPVCDTTLTVTYTSVNGCDSTYILYLEVLQKTPTALDNTDGVNSKPRKFFRNGQMYIRKNGQVYNLQGIKVEED